MTAFHVGQKVRLNFADPQVAELKNAYKDYHNIHFELKESPFTPTFVYEVTEVGIVSYIKLKNMPKYAAFAIGHFVPLEDLKLTGDLL